MRLMGSFCKSTKIGSLCQSFVVNYTYTWSVSVFAPPPGFTVTARVQDGVSGSYMDAVFELVAHEESEIWTSLPHNFTNEDLPQLPCRLV